MRMPFSEGRAESLPYWLLKTTTASGGVIPIDDPCAFAWDEW
jgi:hypothetical protein